jgi:hypothetical protein
MDVNTFFRFSQNYFATRKVGLHTLE